MFPIGRTEILAEIARELGVRRNVFPKWVTAGRITQDEADRRIERMQAGYDFLVDTLPPDHQGKR